MYELIKITTNEQEQKLVTTRELHGFLKVREKFATWFKRRINNYHFEENIYYTTIEGFSQNCEKGGRCSF